MNGDASQAFRYEGLSRYSRQMLVPQIGLQVELYETSESEFRKRNEDPDCLAGAPNLDVCPLCLSQKALRTTSYLGQELLKKAKVLVVGAGGLGCPCAVYLASSGVGEMVIVDDDLVELNNLHRQVMHSEDGIGTPKVSSLAGAIRRLNSTVKVTAVKERFSSKTATRILDSSFDVVVDCTDNAPTRYLINDVAVLRGLPLVSASALKWEGQLTVYNHWRNEDGGTRVKGPCYRCMFPSPPPRAAMGSCSEAGVIGPVPGMLGTMQALEVLKVITGVGTPLCARMLLFDGLSCTARVIKLKDRSPNCDVCGDHPVISVDDLPDYEGFCGVTACDKVISVDLLDASDHVSPQAFDSLRKSTPDVVLLDVRPQLEFDFCRLAHSINIPYSVIEKGSPDLTLISTALVDGSAKSCYVICHRGNDSQRAILRLQQLVPDVSFKNIAGGLEDWADSVDPAFPKY